MAGIFKTIDNKIIKKIINKAVIRGFDILKKSADIKTANRRKMSASLSDKIITEFQGVDKIDKTKKAYGRVEIVNFGAPYRQLFLSSKGKTMSGFVEPYIATTHLLVGL